MHYTCIVVPKALPLEYHYIPLREQYPYILENYSTTITCLPNCQVLVMADQICSLAWSDIMSDQAKRIVMHTGLITVVYWFFCDLGGAMVILFPTYMYM